MANPFLNVITSSMLDTYDNALLGLISSLEVPCKLVMPTTKWETCTSCSVFSANNPNPYISGPIQANRSKVTTSCSICGGTQKIPVENYETINLCCIFEYKKWENLGGPAFVPKGDLQTFSYIDKLEQIKRCKYIIANTSLLPNNKTQFVRDGEPTPCGFRQNFIITYWKLGG